MVFVVCLLVNRVPFFFFFASSNGSLVLSCALQEVTSKICFLREIIREKVGEMGYGRNTGTVKLQNLSAPTRERKEQDAKKFSVY